MLENGANERRNVETNVFSASNAKDEFTFEPLALFEEYMLADDSPQFPMEPVIQLHFRGALNRDVARRAFQTLLARHPLMRSRLVKKHGRLFWTPSEVQPEVVYIDFDATPNVFNESGFPVIRPLDLFAAPGLRVYHIESKREKWFRLVLQFHHTVSDGLGVFQSLEEWLTFYAREIKDLPVEIDIPEISPEAFKARHRIGWSLSSYLKNFSHTRRSTRQYLFFPRSIVPTGLFRSVALETDPPSVTTITLSREETSAYFSRAKAQGATVNDALLADCFRAADRWLRDVKHDEKDGRMRVMSPINMRSNDERRALLANVVSTVFIDRTRREILKEGDSLIKSVSSEMQWVKKRDQRFVFLLILKVLRRIPGSLKLMLHLPICRATCVLTNLGRVLNGAPTRRDDEGRIVVGDATLERIEAETPNRPKTSLSVAGLTYAGELNLCVHHDSRLITPEQAREFVRIFRELLL